MKSHYSFGIHWLFLYFSLGVHLCTSCVLIPREDSSTREKWLFLGNSITYNGRYVDYVETALLLHKGMESPEIINLGLSSETLSGMSEPDHPFPRPALLSRFTACLDTVMPDRVIACYGINDGIYSPFDSIRFAAYTTGIQQLIQETEAQKIKLTLLSPGPFAADVASPQTSDTISNYSYKQPYPQYDTVMEQYTNWLLTKIRGDSSPNVEVINIYDPLSRNLSNAYSSNDPIHPNQTGHAIIAEAILHKWNMSVYPEVLTTGVDRTQQDMQWQEMEQLVKSQRLLYDRALLNRIGHGNPMIRKEGNKSWNEITKAYQSTQRRLASKLTLEIKI